MAVGVYNNEGERVAKMGHNSPKLVVVGDKQHVITARERHLGIKYCAEINVDDSYFTDIQTKDSGKYMSLRGPHDVDKWKVKSVKEIISKDAICAISLLGSIPMVCSIELTGGSFDGLAIYAVAVATMLIARHLHLENQLPRHIKQ